MRGLVVLTADNTKFIRARMEARMDFTTFSEHACLGSYGNGNWGKTFVSKMDKAATLSSVLANSKLG